MEENKKIIVNNRAMGYKPSVNISHNINPPPVALLLAIMYQRHNGEIFLI